MAAEESPSGVAPDAGDERIERALRYAFRNPPPRADESVLDAIRRTLGVSARVVLRGEESRPGTPPAPGGGRYRTLAEIGRGDAGIVFEAVDRSLGRRVALKTLRGEHAADDLSLRRFLEEAQLEGQLQHPGIVPVYGLDLGEGGRPCIAMKLVRGGTLAELLRARARGAPDLRRLLGIFEQICQAIAYAHARGVVHRDLNPSNILVGAFGEVQVIDWGLAETLGGGRGAAIDSSSLARAYAAPELLDADGAGVDERADVFSLGAILCEILTGSAPDATASWTSCGADEELAALTGRCLARRREERPRDAAAVARAIGHYLAAAAERARRAELRAAEERALALQARHREQLESSKARWERRAHRRITVMAGLVSVALLVAVAVYLLQDRAGRLRSERTRAEIAASIREATRFEGEGRWPEAREWAGRAIAAARAGAAGPPALERASAVVTRIEQGVQAAQEATRRAERDAAMVRRLYSIRLSQGIVEGRDAPDVHAQYAEAFREYGVDLEMLAEGRAAAAIRQSAIAQELVSALEDWAWHVRPRGIDPQVPPEFWRSLVETVRQADADEWRDRFRSAAHDADRPALRRLANESYRMDLPPATLTLLGRYLRALQMDRVALNLLRLARRRYPDDFWVNYQLGSVLADINVGPEPPERYYRAAIALRPDCTCLWLLLGQKLELAGDLDGALAAMRRSVVPETEHVVHHVELGRLLMRLERYPEAEETYRRCLEHHPGDAECTRDLAVARWKQGDAPGALALAREATELAPHNVKTWVRLAELLLIRDDVGSGDRDAGLAAAEKAVEVASGFWRARVMRGYALYRVGRYAEALEELEHAGRLREGAPSGPLDRRHCLLLALAHHACGHAEEARFWFGKAVPDTESQALSEDLERLHAEAKALLGRD